MPAFRHLTTCLALAVASQPALGGVAFDIEDFGAVPNDGLDDRPAVQAALDAACNEVALGTGDVSVYVPPGVFSVAKGPEPSATLPWVLLTLPCGGFTLRGEPTSGRGSESVLRLADAQGAFESMLGTETFAQRLDGFTLRDLTLDGNGSANPILGGDEDMDDPLREPRYALRVYAGSGLRVESSRFVGWRNLNVVTANGVDVSDVTIVGNRFEAVGQPSTTAPDWDHSTIYTDADGARIEDNVFSSLGPGTFGVRTAIETHGPGQIVRGNRVEDFTTGINVTGVSALGSSVHRVEDNLFLRVADGIRIWAFEVAGNVPGEPVLEDVVIRRNRIEIAVDPWRVTQDLFEQANVGLALVDDSDGVIENLTLEDNHVIFTDFGTDPRPYDRNSAGIRLAPVVEPEPPIRGLVIRGNTLENAPATAVYIGSPLPEGAEVSDNEIVDAGLGPPSIPDGLRTGILIFGAYRDVEILDTCFIDTDPSGPRLAQAFYLFGDSLGGSLIARSASALAGGTLDFVRVEEPLGEPWQVEAPSPRCSRLFRDGVESGDLSAWSSSLP